MATFPLLPKHIKRAYQNSFVLALFAGLVAIFVFVPYLNSYPMQNWDEGFYAQATKEMVSSHDIWSLTYQHNAFYEKPPLLMWLSYPVVQIFHEANWTFRFWGALAGVASAIIFSLFVWQKEKRPSIAWLATVIFLSAEALLYHCFRTGDTDGLLIFFLIFGLFAYWKSWLKPSWILGTAIAFSLAVMSKSAAGLIGPVIVLCDILFSRRWNIVRSKYFWYSILAFISVVAPWHIAQTILHGHEFWSSYLGSQIVGRTVLQIFAQGFPWYWYIGVFARRFFPFSLFFPAALLLSIRQIIRGKKDSMFILLWALVPLIVYSIAITKFEWYILPVYPAAAWLIARLIIAATDKLTPDRLAQVLAVVSVGAAVFFFARYATPHFLTDQYSALATTTRYGISGVMAAALCMLFVVSRNKKKAMYGLIALSLVFCFFVSYARTIKVVVTQTRHSPYQDVARIVNDQGASRVVVFDSDLYTKPAGYFELSRVVEEILPVVQEEAWKVRHLALPGTVVITSATADLSVAKKDTLIGVVDSYNLYYVPKH
ncbi:MAG: hypothetical protein COT25_02085 [Candidatus Kerfeldbacteria bacterium CG08_land_8_20_14_0_20_42_7]|uniref:Glycosyltransferase RgtA/B/C/D-like domain-containing protein n=1 Tax=Candidatus Kerfeldbacteria bacterium CG08_land_8_20_14_0_20_42_7 TaxID=2014245 RepID=A0A2H0YT11_9BACT|nr:MAG: hypothetical protein COT25_02085 [Candidatus Kerfeldbacteria bacterium CG08_land_8_20_14_0_20_42_7]